MKRIRKPQITQDVICSSIKNLEYIDRIIEKSDEYDKDIYNIEAFLKDEKEFSKLNEYFKDYMKKMYSSRFANSSPSYEASYKIYKEIRSSVKLCPYCNYPARPVRQLDHYLPKSVFPTLAITANNLVPICKDCNEDKDDYYPTNKEEMLLHPYYDDVANDILNFLKCKIIEDDNIGFEFYIEKQKDWDDIMFKRVKCHFEKLKLNELYSGDFIADFAVFIAEIESFASMFGSNSIDGFIQMKIQALKKVGNKPWSYAGFKSILDSDWCMKTYIPILFKSNFKELDI